jgi:hypothetical protein
MANGKWQSGMTEHMLIGSGPKHLPSVISHPLCAIRHQTSAIRHQPFTIERFKQHCSHKVSENPNMDGS